MQKIICFFHQVKTAAAQNNNITISGVGYSEHLDRNKLDYSEQNYENTTSEYFYFCKKNMSLHAHPDTSLWIHIIFDLSHFGLRAISGH